MQGSLGYVPPVILNFQLVMALPLQHLASFLHFAIVITYKTERVAWELMRLDVLGYSVC